MSIVARRIDGYRHEISARKHTIAADEPEELGGADTAPTAHELLAASLAACTAITVEMYADRKGWEVGDVEVEVDVRHADRTHTTFELLLRLPKELGEEQTERLKEIAGHCPVHRTLMGEVSIADEVQLV